MVVGIVPLLCMTCSMVENCVCMAWRCLSCVACRRPPPSNGMCFFRADRLTFCNKSTLAAAQQKGGWRLAFKFKLASDRRTELCEEAGASTARINHTEVGVNQRSRQNIYIYICLEQSKKDISTMASKRNTTFCLFYRMYEYTYVRSFVRVRILWMSVQCTGFPGLALGNFYPNIANPCYTATEQIINTYCTAYCKSCHLILFIFTAADDQTNNKKSSSCRSVPILPMRQFAIFFSSENGITYNQTNEFHFWKSSMNIPFVCRNF